MSAQGDDKADDRLSGARAKLERAGEHMDQVSKEFETFFKVEDVFPFVIEGEFDAESRVYALYARLQIDLPAERWGVLVGDFAHNARSALDHAAWALADHRGITGRNPRVDRRIQFPIADDRAGFEREANRFRGLPAADL
jgi:hypothetical protein